MAQTCQSDDDVEEVLNVCDAQEAKGGSQWPGMTYEQGVAAALRWVLDGDSHPINEV